MTLQVILILKIWISIFYIFLVEVKNEKKNNREGRGQENEKEERWDLWG